MINGCQIRILTSVAEIEELRDVWKRWPSLPYSDIDFFLTSLKTHTNVVTPHVIVISSADVPRAMAVGYVEEGHLPFKISHLSLFRARLRTLTITPGGLLGDQSGTVVNALVSTLLATLKSGAVDAVRLPQLRSDSEFFKLLQWKTPFYCRDHSLEFRQHWKMQLPGNSADIYAGYSSEHRKKLRWQLKNFEKNFPGGLRIHCFQKPEELPRMIEDVEAISRMTYQRVLGASFIDTPATRARVALEAERGWLRMPVLYVNDEPCAYWWGTAYNQTFYSEAMGFVPAYRKFSPGTYLLIKTLEDLCQNGMKDLDFGAGDFHYKQKFGTVNWEETMVFNIFAPRLRPVALNLANSLIGQFRFLSRSVVNRLHLPKLTRKLAHRGQGGGEHLLVR